MARQALKRSTGIDPEIESSDLEHLIGYNLKRAYVIVQTDFRRTLGDDGMSARVFSALSLCVRYPNITQSELARKMGIERSGLVAIVDALEAKTYLRRAPVPGDRRVQALVPTDAGRTAYREAIAAVQAHEDRLFADMTAGEKETLLSLLKRIRARGEAE
ncbi:MarR family winged helix-turn-helix transcriptional regulator [Cognatishimia sp. F0-27]|uniref:MarR family winged helix-turn-helix transcriptional regulator n=1 Tax=Cognatishimia sp. F0-27 TaxID=2816855 RepID=UPI001D0C33D6|nr:MarR family transcriptional regulator [Cognatishimia sp. F0-27]MCC1493211.1 MarR family transcriptional regulator [Cognatishimia sp. F0-27]